MSPILTVLFMTRVLLLKFSSFCFIRIVFAAMSTFNTPLIVASHSFTVTSSVSPIISARIIGSPTDMKIHWHVRASERSRALLNQSLTHGYSSRFREAMIKFLTIGASLSGMMMQFLCLKLETLRRTTFSIMNVILFLRFLT